MPAGLAYTSDNKPGFRRVRSGKGFAYRDARGKLLRDAEEIARIRKLAIPPAYQDVWICPRPNGHLQATGRDARGRKQYRYHPQWRVERDSGKYNRLLDFAKALPVLRRRIAADLKAPALSFERVLATMVRLLDTTFIRVGNDEYARENGSFGLTTLRNRHVKLASGELTLSFRGKSGVLQEMKVQDARVVQVVRSCLHLPGQELFQYKDDKGECRTVGSSDINDYLHECCGERFTAKDFRTWHGTVLAWRSLAKAAVTMETDPAVKFTMKNWLASVAERLGNTPAVCRKAYIHTQVLEAAILMAQRGADLSALKAQVNAAVATRRGLTVAERALLGFLAAQQAKKLRADSAGRRARHPSPLPKGPG
ncbi:MAG: DNA topoisomerase IB [Bdellovibrionales bacterium]|nr:DNA topoisomerase IB [Ramlibacter sp.]